MSIYVGFVLVTKECGECKVDQNYYYFLKSDVQMIHLMAVMYSL